MNKYEGKIYDPKFWVVMLVLGVVIGVWEAVMWPGLARIPARDADWVIITVVGGYIEVFVMGIFALSSYFVDRYYDPMVAAVEDDILRLDQILNDDTDGILPDGYCPPGWPPL